MVRTKDCRGFLLMLVKDFNFWSCWQNGTSIVLHPDQVLETSISKCWIPSSAELWCLREGKWQNEPCYHSKFLPEIPFYVLVQESLAQIKHNSPAEVKVQRLKFKATEVSKFYEPRCQIERSCKEMELQASAWDPHGSLFEEWGSCICTGLDSTKSKTATR